MSDSDDLQRENQALRDRLARLTATSLRVSASLDFRAILSEVVESACAMTGARHGAVTTTPDGGPPWGFITSGLTSSERERLVNWSERWGVFEHFRKLPGTLRRPDLPAYVRSLGADSSRCPQGAFQAAPILHRGARVGVFMLVGKNGEGEFTADDEEIMMLFASQAAAAIAVARAYRDPQRAWADLETVVETSPVGVVVFDAKTAHSVSHNREAGRIVEGLLTPGQSPEELLDVVTCRRADGREVSLREVPLPRLLSVAEPVHAEEIELSVADGRSVRMLINSTPNRSANGEVESVVVTMQDLAPLDALERSRTEFLSLVSHELRAPLASIKGAAATVLGATTAMDPAEMQQFFRIIDEQADHMRSLISDLLDAGRIETGTLSVAPEPTEVARLVDQARNTFVSGGGRQRVSIDLAHDLPRVLADRQRIGHVLNNLFANAARHAPELSPIRVSAVRDGLYVAISVADEGRGVPPDQLPLLFRKHARIGGSAGGIQGTGLGLSICRGLVEAHGGRIRAESGGAGLGTTITFTIPVAEEAEVPTGAAPRHARAPGEVQAPTRILVVDDDPQTLRYVRGALTEAGYAPVVTGDPQEVPDLLESERPSLVLLDLLLPGVDGIELMERIPELSDLPVIFISAYGRDETIARALEMGAVDYIVKPFSPTELTARVRAALRRQAAAEPFRLGALAIDFDQRRVTVGGNPVELTATEYDLLRVLAENAGRVVTHEDLLRKVWRRHEAGDSKLVRAFVKKLRQKLGDDAANPTYISSVRRVGYRMAQPGNP